MEGGCATQKGQSGGGDALGGGGEGMRIPQMVSWSTASCSNWRSGQFLYQKKVTPWGRGATPPLQFRWPPDLLLHFWPPKMPVSGLWHGGETLSSEKVSAPNLLSLPPPGGPSPPASTGENAPGSSAHQPNALRGRGQVWQGRS